MPDPRVERIPVNPQLLSSLDAVFRHHSDAVRSVVATLAESGGHFTRASDFARRLGLRDRDTLYQLLRGENVPSLCVLARLVRVLNWAIQTELYGFTLSQIASIDARYVSQYAADVRKALGVSRTELRELGPEWVRAQIAKRIGPA